MKNIHILPTENESRIRYNSFNKVYELCEFTKYHTDIKSTHNIYITNDEPAYPYALHLKNQEVFKTRAVGANSLELYHDKGFSYPDECRKIILTTDQDLIKDGVQAIDDEFLEWFVKNPSCEEVEVLFACRGLDGNTPIGEYRIIIPKEKPKQETLSEAALKYSSEPQYFGKESGFRAGAKWQAERMYSEEEVLTLISDYIKDNLDPNTHGTIENVKDWFEQFKNK
jgi:hypothetical protein